MNFFDGRLVSDNGGLYFDEGGIRVRLLDEHAKRLASRADKQAVLGVRPEAMGLTGQGRFAGNGNVLPVKLAVVEPLGEKMDLCAATQSCPHLVARVDARGDVSAGQDLDLHLDMRKIHVFEPGPDGTNLLASPAEA